MADLSTTDPGQAPGVPGAVVLEFRRAKAAASPLPQGDEDASLAAAVIELAGVTQGQTQQITRLAEMVAGVTETLSSSILQQGKRIRRLETLTTILAGGLVATWVGVILLLIRAGAPL